MSDEVERELAKLAESDPAAAFRLFRMHQRIPWPKGESWPSCCGSCRALLEKTRAWFERWTVYLLDPRYRFVFEHPEVFEGKVSHGHEWGVPVLDELRQLAAQADTMSDVIRHVIGGDRP